MYVNPGELNKRIQIISRTKSVDSDGCYATNDTVVYTCWAKYSQASGTELVMSGADFAEIKVRFLIRYTSTAINRKMLVRYAGNDYEITYINGYGDNKKYTEIWCTRITMEA